MPHWRNNQFIAQQATDLKRAPVRHALKVLCANSHELHAHVVLELVRPPREYAKHGPNSLLKNDADGNPTHELCSCPFRTSMTRNRVNSGDL